MKKKERDRRAFGTVVKKEHKTEVKKITAELINYPISTKAVCREFHRIGLRGSIAIGRPSLLNLNVENRLK